MILDFSNWDIAEDFSPASGASEKEWIINPSKTCVGLFKFPKSDETYEHFSEKISFELAKIIGVESAKIDLGIYCDTLGSISYLINDSSKESLIEGVTLISKFRENYDTFQLKDLDSDEYYSFDMILESIKPYGLKNDFFKVVIFDYIIGNSDRHHSNWGVLESDSTIRFCPVYDNGSSLCCYVKESDIISKINDNQWFNSIVVSKSRSIIRLDKIKKAKPTHREVVQYLSDNYYKETVDFVINIKEKLNDEVISTLIETYSYNILTEERKSFLKRYLSKKVEELISIYKLK